ncbi:hypothetical protein Dcar01_01199 [Deinococcus carri]|uniref:Uncharacterized protein n=1 Tax=Deinococcus carri TaxID=1211323 RepID=A0ABP9W6S0_9DEIO
MTDAPNPFAAYHTAVAAMKAPLLDSPLKPVIAGLTVEAASPHRQVRLHVTLHGTLAVAALLGEPSFRDRLAPMLSAEDVERAWLHFEHGNLAALGYTTRVTGVDVGTAALLGAVVREYVQALRFQGEMQVGLHAPGPRTEVEIAASSSLNPQWRPPVFTISGAVHLTPAGLRAELDPPGGSEPLPF